MVYKIIVVYKVVYNLHLLPYCYSQLGLINQLILSGHLLHSYQFMAHLVP